MAPSPARAPRDGLRGVLFDLDGTMYVQSVLRGLMAAELAVGLASRRLRRQDIRRLAKFRREREALKHQSSEGVVLERWQYEVHGEGADSLETLVQEWMHRRPLKYLRACRRRGLVELLTMLSARGYRLGVLSDFPVADKLGALGVDRWFSLMLCTTDPEINALKPSARGFLHACRLWGLAPHEVLYVGDRIDVDAQGAAAAGLDCWIVGPRKGHLDPSTPQHHVGTFSQLKHALSGR
jgi:HAD superfamily hydrolase (TIGR01549 family)